MMHLGAFPSDCTLSPRERVVTVARILTGVPYKWGGNLLRDGGLDCSGFVQLCFAEAGIVPWAADYPGRYDLTAAGLYEELHEVAPDEHALPGDCVFYGTGARVSHVVLVTAIAAGGEITEVVGASRGDRTLVSVDAALARGSRVRTFASEHYRPDFVAFRRCPVA